MSSFGKPLSSRLSGRKFGGTSSGSSSINTFSALASNTPEASQEPDLSGGEENEDAEDAVVANAEQTAVDVDSAGNISLQRELLTMEQIQKEAPHLYLAEPDDCYSDDAAAITGHYNARDRPNLELTNASSRSMGQKVPAAIMFTGEELVSRYRLKEKMVFGAGLKGDQGGKLKQSVYFSWHMHSQRPGFKVHIRKMETAKIAVESTRPTYEEVVCHIYVNNMLREWYHAPVDDDDDEEAAAMVDVKLNMFHGTDDNIMRAAQDTTAELQTYAQQSSLFMLETQLFDSRLGEPYMYRGPKPARPSFSGLNEKDLTDWMDILEYQGASALKEWQLIVLLLADLGNRITIFREWNVENAQEATQFGNWMYTAVRKTAEYGNLWTYSLQQSLVSRFANDICNPQSRIDLVHIPRWLTKKWLATRDGNGKLIAVTPHECASFDQDRAAMADLYPDAATFATEMKIALERERAFQSYTLKAAFDVPAWSIVGTFTAQPKRIDCFVVEARPGEGRRSILQKDRSLRPRVNARVEVDVKSADFEHTSRILTLRGKVCEDHWKSGAELVAFVTGPALGQIFPEHKFSHGQELQCNVRLIDDPTPITRCKAALTELQLGISQDPKYGRSTGVDHPHAFLRAPATIEPEKTGILAQQLKQHPAAARVFDDTIAQCDYNTNQLQLVRNSRDSSNAVTVCLGPPGTGKSKVLAGLAIAHARAGKEMAKVDKALRRPVICTAGSNFAVDELLGKIKDGLDSEQPDLIVVRFKGIALRQVKAKKDKKDKEPDPDAMDLSPNNKSAEPKEPISDEQYMEETQAGDDHIDYSDDDWPARVPSKGSVEKALDRPNQARKEDLPSAEEDLDREEAMWETLAEQSEFLRKDPHEEEGYMHQRMLWMNRVAATKGTGDEHSMLQEVLEYRHILERLEQDGLTKETRSELKEDRWSKEDILNEYFLGEVVDILCPTNSSAAHGIARQFFHPRVHIGDEAAVSSFADAITPSAVFKNDIQAEIICGDHEQQEPVVMSKKCNEQSPTLEVSLFRTIWENDNFRESRVTLNVQHRMHPEISDLISQVMYPKVPGGLLNHPCTSAPNAKWVTMRDFMFRFGAAWNGRRRTFIDVSGSKEAEVPIKSDRKEGSTSWRNVAEADAIAFFIEAALKHPVPEGGEQLEARDFLCLSPYSDQCAEITSRLYSLDVNKKGSKVRVINTRTIQGGEGLFVLFSMVRCNNKSSVSPLELGFSAEKASLNVALSRAKQALICFGNWLALYKLAAVRHQLINPHKDTARFRHLGLIAEFGWDKKEMIAYPDFLSFLDATAAPPEKSAILEMVSDLELAKVAQKNKRRDDRSARAEGEGKPLTLFEIYEAKENAQKRQAQRDRQQQAQASRTQSGAAARPGQSDAAAAAAAAAAPTQPPRKKRRRGKGAKGRAADDNDDE